MQKLIVEILKNSSDPLKVRQSTASLFKNLKNIKVNLDKINKAANIVKEKVNKNQILDQEQFGSLNPTPQLIFILDSINFCFWAEKNKEKWTVEFPRGNFISNGWYGLVAALERARNEGIPILDPKYLKNLTQSEGEYIFRSSSKTKMPLLNKRIKILNETGKILLEKYEGNIYNLISKTGLNAAKISKQIIANFPAYADLTNLNSNKIYFYKRAQIFAYDISLLPELKVTNLKSLTAFADYKIPQILRAFEILNYNEKLAEKIDNYQVLDKQSREEAEIRSATIWACEIIAHKAGIIPVLVDNALWKMSQSLRDVKPYHRVLTTSY